MKLPKKLWLSVTGVIVIIVVIAIFVLTRQGSGQEFVLDKVTRGNLIQTVEATGELESLDKVELSFQISGNVEEIFVDVGDEVAIGDYLAVLEADELGAQARQAEQALDIAHANLNLELAGAGSEAIAVKMADITIAEVALSAAESDYTHIQATEAATVRIAEIALDTKEDDLANVLASNIQDLSDTKEDYVNAMKSATIEIRAGLSEADQVLGIENGLLNIDFFDMLASADPSTLYHANRYFGFARASRDIAEDAVFVLSADSDDTDVNAAAEFLETALEDSALALLYTHQALDATILEDADFSITDLLALKTTINSARTQIQNEEASFFLARQSYANAIIDTNVAEDNARNNLAKSEQDLIKAEASEASQVAASLAAFEQAEASLTKAQATLGDLIADPRAVDLAAYQADVRRSQADLDAAYARLAKAEIVSPINGKVTNIEIEIGEQASPATSVITVQTIEDEFQVVLDVSESDIAKVSLNDPATITFDAFGEYISFDGFVGTIDPAETKVEGVVFYEVGIFFAEDNPPLELKPGMSADVTITTEQVADVLFVPRRSVLESDGVRYVRTPRGNNYDEVVVDIGLKADEGKVEIISGLIEGEDIIVTVR
ncbi:MAG: efflux RND transporter periplasmic adaptor subunit [Candidatus Uhrbacteria bacterium]|nr:efflux RND transporter periplasmic adaptor subunit [Candidatus Uhrbacteria bacterium]